MPIYAHLQEILGIIIILMPLILFIITLVYFMNKIDANQIKLMDLLAEPEVMKPNKSSTENSGDAQPRADSQQPPKRSTSRFILFLTGIVTLVLTACFTTYYFYMKIYTVGGNQDLDLSGFTNVLLALGIGVIPYSINQVKKISL